MRPVMILALAAAFGCGKEIGDACIVSTDCDPAGTRICDTTTGSKEGYCTIMGCDYNTCPEEAVCVRFFTGEISNTNCDYTTEGKTTTVVAGPMVRNFDRIRAGDKVALRYQESVSVVAMSGIDATPSRAQSVDVTGAPLGQKPAGTIVATDEVIAEVVGLKPEDRTVTLKGPLRTVTVQVAEKVKGYDRLKVGDKVVLRVTQALAIEVTAQ